MKRALLIFNSDFVDRRLSALHAAEHDVEKLKQLLQSDLVGFAPENITLSKNAPLGDIRQDVQRFFSDADRDDYLFFYYAGHGIRNEMGELYLALKRTTLDDFEALSLEASFIRRNLERSLAQQKIVMLDCCHAGAFSVKDGYVARDAPFDLGMIRDSFDPQGTGTYVLGASQSGASAFETKGADGKPYSLFTDAFIRGIETGAAAPGKEIITLADISSYIHSKRNSKGKATTPYIDIENAMGILEFARKPKPTTGEIVKHLEQENSKHAPEEPGKVKRRPLLLGGFAGIAAAGGAGVYFNFGNSSERAPEPPPESVPAPTPPQSVEGTGLKYYNQLFDFDVEPGHNAVSFNISSDSKWFLSVTENFQILAIDWMKSLINEPVNVYSLFLGNSNVGAQTGSKLWIREDDKQIVFSTRNQLLHFFDIDLNSLSAKADRNIQISGTAFAANNAPALFAYGDRSGNLVIARQDGSVKNRIAFPEWRKRPRFEQEIISAIEFYPKNPNKVFVGTSYGRLYLVDTKSGLVSSIRDPQPSGEVLSQINGMKFSQKGDKVFVGFTYDGIHILPDTFDSYEHSWNPTTKANRIGSLYGFSVSNLGDKIVALIALNEGSKIQVYSVPEQKEFKNSADVIKSSPAIIFPAEDRLSFYFLKFNKVYEGKF